jgi:hypothetical protein
MPMQAAKLGAAARIAPLKRIAEELLHAAADKGGAGDRGGTPQASAGSPD